MPRRLIRLAGYAGTFLFLLVIALWVRGYRSADAIHFQRTTRGGDAVWRTSHVGVLGSRGRIVLYRQTSQAIRADDAPPRAFRVRHLQAVPYNFIDELPRTATSSETFGFAVARDFTSPASRAVVVPFFAVALLTLPLALLAVREWRGRIIRRRRVRLGLCPDCGYDLRATPGTCPECGWSDVTDAAAHCGDASSVTMTPQGQEA